MKNQMIPKNDISHAEREAFRRDREHRQWLERARRKRDQEQFFQSVVFTILTTAAALLVITGACAIAARLLAR